MKSGSKTRKTQNETAVYAIQNSTVDLSLHCPTLNQIVETNEFNLLDLSRLQTDVERLLAATTQRMTCISHYLRGLPIPPPILRNLGLLDPDPNNRPQHPRELVSNSVDTSARKTTATDEDGSLVVTANPDKPLSLIFSSQRKQQQYQHPSQPKTESKEALQTSKNKSKYDSNSSSSVAFNPIVSPHDIPNRFWALMEPYCADITESNISYLEGILKSYVEEATTSKYFLLPQSRSFKDSAVAECISPKRLRRDSTKAEVVRSDAPETSSDQDHISEAFKAASEMVSLARHVGGQLKGIKPASSPSVEQLLCSLEKDLYEDNVSSVLRRAVTHMAQEFTNKSSPGETEPSFLPIQNNGSDLTSVCSQPLKNLARQLQVSSSFRVEKKISQAIEELGLFPLTLYLNHLAHYPERPLARLSEKTPVQSTPEVTETENHDLPPSTDCKSPLVNGLDHSPKEVSSSPSSPSSIRRGRIEAIDSQKSLNPQSNGCSSLRNETENSEEITTTPTTTTEPSSGGNEENTSPADAEMGGTAADVTAEVAPPPPPLRPPTDSNCPSVNSEPTLEHADPCQTESLTALNECISEEKDYSSENNISYCPGPSTSSVKPGEDPVPMKCSPQGSAICNGDTMSDENEWFSGSLPHLEDADDDDLSSCLLNLTAANAEAIGGDVSSSSTDQLTLALMRRQRELRLVCAANHNILHRLIQAARRDLQRQEIQRRLAIADADVIEAYNRLESYKLQKRSALKRDRDFAWKTLKERQKIRAELDAFDKKPP